jgi:dCTP deaminase
VIVKPGQAIAKIEFSVLPRDVERPYTGQHGYETEIWPIPFHLYASAADLRRAGIDLAHDKEIARVYGPIIADMARRFRYYQSGVWIQIALTILGFIVIFALSGELGLVSSVLTGVLANLLTTLGTHLYSRRRLNRLV